MVASLIEQLIGLNPALIEQLLRVTLAIAVSFLCEMSIFQTFRNPDAAFL